MASERNFGARVLLLVGSIGPIGHCPASGTVAVAVAGIPLYMLMWNLDTPLYLAITAAFALASVWIHQVGDRLLGEKDSRKIVWDELAGYMVAVAFLPSFTLRLAVTALLIERTLDIAKVWPANLVERRVPGGWGVVGDDLVAGLYTAAIMQATVRWAPALVGL